MEQLGDLPETQSLVKSVIGLAMKVHRTLGSGFLELVYANALAIELQRNSFAFVREGRIAVLYEGVPVGDYFADFILGDKLVIEIKAVECLNPTHSRQLVNYLAATRFDLGLLINFGAKSLEFKTKTRFYDPSPNRGPKLEDPIPQFSNSVNSV